MPENEVLQFVDAVASLQADNAFNPYRDRCPTWDKADAVSIRRKNLSRVLSAALAVDIDSVWIARDLGYRGGRRTGLALTDEVNLSHQERLLGCEPLDRATVGAPVQERTAKTVWGLLNEIQRPIFLWNVFPLQPHPAGQPFANRCHTLAEGAMSADLLVWLLAALKPIKVVSIGKDAHTALEKLGTASLPARHPSYGGEREFRDTIKSIYGL